MNTIDEIKNVIFKNQKLTLPSGEVLETEQGVVIVGANGSGKTRLGSWIDLKSNQSNYTHRISAQKSLQFPESVNSMAVDKSESMLLYGYHDVREGSPTNYKMGHRWHNLPDTSLLNDYEKLLIYLFSENNEESSRYKDEARKSTCRIEPPITKLDRVKEIWEKVMSHRELVIGSGNVTARDKKNSHINYNAAGMSDGERVSFYLIGQCISVPRDHILIIDEPELHLHKSIQYALWNEIEKARRDCCFVYLTHDVEFAASRANFKKIWIRNYDGSKWVLDEINSDGDLPEELLLEIYGSRKKVLLVEGDNSSFDTQLYRSIFDNFLVKPCGSCENVILYTKALRSNYGFHQLDVFGLIDKDRRTQEDITALEEAGIFTLKIAEVENLFITPGILKIVAERLMFNSQDKLEEVKKYIMNALRRELDQQIFEHTHQKYKYLLTKADLKGSCLETLKHNHNQFVQQIDSISSDIKKQFGEILANENYEKLLVVYNRKNIFKCIAHIFGLDNKKNLPEFVIRLAQDSSHAPKVKSSIKEYLPERFNLLTEEGNKSLNENSLIQLAVTPEN